MLIFQLITAFVISFIVNFAVILYFTRHKNLACDKIDDRPQRFHINLTPRIGGAGIFLAFSSPLLFMWLYYTYINTSVHMNNLDYYAYLPLTALPVFLAGFTEDLTGRVGSKIRLSAALLSALLAIYFLKSFLLRTDIGIIDGLFSIRAVSVAFSVIGIVGLANSFNIIDGFNGLSSAVSVMILLSLAYVAFKSGDLFVIKASLILIFSIFGFFIWNYPFGKIFLGDGGAYLIGFTVAVISILLVDTNKEVSAWFPFLLCFYPIFETLFSIYRKTVRKTSPMEPDGLHLHMLVYKRVIPRIFGNDINNNPLYRNFMTSPILWLINSLSVIPAILFWNNTPVLIVFVVIFTAVYLWIYKSITGFKLRRFIKRKV